MTNTTIKIENIATQAMEYALSYIKAYANKETENEEANFGRDCSYRKSAITSRNTVINTIQNDPTTGNKRQTFVLLNYVKKHNVGNCGECAALVLEFMLRNYPGVEAELFFIENGSHCFGVINRRAGSDPCNPSTWGDDCWFCDPWGRKCGKASELIPFLKKLSESNRAIFALNTEPHLEHYYSIVLNNTEPCLGQLCNSSALLEIMKNEFSQGLDDLIKRLSSISSLIEQLIETYEKSLDERLNNWLKNEKQKIGVFLLEVTKLKKEFSDNYEKCNYLELEQEYRKVKDGLVKSIRKTVLEKDYNDLEQTPIVNKFTRMEELCNNVIKLEIISLESFDFPDAPETSNFVPTLRLTRTFNDGTKERRVVKATGKEYSPGELVARETTREDDWSNISKVKITDTKGQTLIIEKQKRSFAFWVNKACSDGVKKLETESSMSDVVFSL